MYSVRRKQQMLKIRLMGTKSDIRWFQNFLQIDSDIEVLELMATQAAQKRMEKAIGKTIPKKQIKAPAPQIKAKYPIMDLKNLPFNTVFQVIDKKDLEFYKEAEKTDKSIKVCEVNEEDFLYLNFDTNPKPTEEELMQMLEKEKYNSEVQLIEDSQFNENIADEMKQYRREQLEKE